MTRRVERIAAKVLGDQTDTEFGILPSAEIDVDEVKTLAEGIASTAGRLIEAALFLPAVPLASCGGKGSCAAAGTDRPVRAHTLLSWCQPRPCPLCSSRRPEGAPRGAGKGKEGKAAASAGRQSYGKE
jgi:hypothetical protein